MHPKIRQLMEDPDARCEKCGYGIEMEFNDNFYRQCWVAPPQSGCEGKNGDVWGRFPTVRDHCLCPKFFDRDIDDSVINCSTCDHAKQSDFEILCSQGSYFRVRREHFCAEWTQESCGIQSERAKELSEISGIDDVPF